MVAVTAAHRPLIWDRRLLTLAAQARALLLLLLVTRCLMMALVVTRSAGHPGQQPAGQGAHRQQRQQQTAAHQAASAAGICRVVGTGRPYALVPTRPSPCRPSSS